MHAHRGCSALRKLVGAMPREKAQANRAAAVGAAGLLVVEQSERIQLRLTVMSKTAAKLSAFWLQLCMRTR